LLLAIAGGSREVEEGGSIQRTRTDHGSGAEEGSDLEEEQYAVSVVMMRKGVCCNDEERGLV
jgi:hypothetical protein